MDVPGFTRFHNIIQRDAEHDGVSLLEVRDGVIYVKEIGKPLEHVPANLRFALDETSVAPDFPMLKSITMNRSIPLSREKAAIWTLLPVMCGNGKVISALLLQRCQSLSVDAVKFTSANNLCATENAQQSTAGYEREYTALMLTCNISRKVFDDVELIGCVVRALNSLKTKNNIIIDCFEKAELLSGYNDVTTHFPPAKFDSGIPLRDTNLPQVNDAYVKAVLSLTNLAGAIGEPVMNEQHRMMRGYVQVGQGFRSFYFAIGNTADTGPSDAANTMDSESIDATVSVITNVRKLFKLGKALNVPRGAPGRLATAYGSLASAYDQWYAALRAEDTARCANAMKSARIEARALADFREKPLIEVLVAGGFMRNEDRLVKKTLVSMLTQNPQIMKATGLSVSSGRGAMVTALLSLIQANSIAIAPNQAENTSTSALA